VAGAVYYWSGGEAEVEADVPETTLVEVERGPIVMSVSTTGRVVANLDVDIKCKASGEIIKLPFDVSDTVRKGELLVELDPVDEQRIVKQAQISLSATEARLAKARQSLLIAQRDLEAERKRAEAALKSAQARAGDAQAKFERTKTLLAKKLASQEEYDTAQTQAIQAASDLESARIRVEEVDTQEKSLELSRQDVTLAEAQVESDRIALSTAQQRLDDTKVYAPIDGVVSVRNVQIGQIISSGISNVGGGTTILTISDLVRLFILAAVDESDIGRIETGQVARITADAFPEMGFMGSVVRIATKGISTSNVVTFEVKIEVLGKNKHMLKPEMTANIEIVAQEEESALLVPVEAVSRKKRERIVTVQKDDGTTEERPVTCGITDGVNIAVTGGLSEGEKVVVRKGDADSRWRGMRGPRMMFGGMRGRKKK
jgi:multidrug efflux pump subunit AcrA (membrane-fusion protein)